MTMWKPRDAQSALAARKATLAKTEPLHSDTKFLSNRLFGDIILIVNMTNRNKKLTRLEQSFAYKPQPRAFSLIGISFGTSNSRRTRASRGPRRSILLQHLLTSSLKLLNESLKNIFHHAPRRTPPEDHRARQWP
jgi:hypothetical protein